MAAIKDQRVLEQFTQVVVDIFLFRSWFNILRDFHTCARSKLIERFLEIKILTLHNELKDVTTLIALTKTAPGAALRPDDERGRMLVVMERAKPRIVFARVTQLNTSLRDQIDNIYFGFDFICDRRHAGEL